MADHAEHRMAEGTPGQGHAVGAGEDKLGQVAMRIIAGGIVCGIVLILIVNGVDAFPYGVYGLIGAVVLATVSFLVGQVE